MFVLETDDLGASYPNLLTRMRSEGDLVELEGEQWLETRPLVLRLSNPRRCIVAREGFSEALMWLDMASVLSGTFDIELYDRVSSNAAKHLNVIGAYGPRVERQLLEVRDVLRSRPASRRGVVMFSGSGELYNPRPGGLPCTLSWQFLCRDDKLTMINHMRANDVVWGLSYDVPTACGVGQAMAADLGLYFAEYSHLVGAGCLYERHKSLMGRISSYKLPILSSQPLEATMSNAKEVLVQLREGNYSETWPYWKRAIAVWQRHFKL